MELASLPNGLELYTESPTEAEYLYKEMYEHGCYDSISLPDDPFVLDVGANIGMFSLYTKQRYPKARIMAFEPIPVTRGILERNIALHGLTDIQVEGHALGAETEADVVFTHYPRLPGNSTRYPEQKQLQIDVCLRLYPDDDTIEQHQGYEVTVPVDRLSRRLPADTRVDLLKVDVEGAEYEVLLGIDPEDWARIDRIILEVQDLDGRLDRINGFLAGKGYRTETMPSPMVEEEILTFLVTAVREGL
ncbi:FkbM family methyltransferase [Streptomyces litchfieldiae]|uniref:FkbM family methyltransferase n=1 Tax=Streptomyces litchfieldiae TaxID=3075543 RepID=A0ABU2MSD1_9ACTN|nr:FkbM family methyltransferase [Streptomyces sp. DSM 44938]MDT0344430.1 FkbM family methyltransferase [Streptomyces sp. DSM 44938]